MNKFEIKTRIMSQPNGSGQLILTVTNGWWFNSRFVVEDSSELRTYLKSDEFKEYAYSVFSKYESMTYEEMDKTDREADFQKIWDKLDRFAWMAKEEEPLRISVDVKLTRRYSNGFRYRVEFSNNKNSARNWYSMFHTGIFKKCEVDWQLEHIDAHLHWDKALNDKLATYKTWDEFRNDFNNTDDITDMVEKCVAA
jgi:hypothetical protein